MTEAAYSPRLRTGVILSGAGTAGAYHAGALQAISEAGIKIDVIAAHGAGAATAMATSVDGGPKIWDPAGPWTSPRVRQAYRWRAALRFAMAGLLVAVILLVSPLVVLVLAAAMYAVATVVALLNLPETSAQLVGLYQRLIELLFDPPILPTIVPRLILFGLLVTTTVLLIAAVRAARDERTRRRMQGAFWWRLLGYPLDGHEPGATFVDLIWRLVRGASHEPRPSLAEVGRRYVDVLADNFNQPGFHEVLIAVHDLDGRRDLVGAVLGPAARAAFAAPRDGLDWREAETVDFTGPERDLVMDFLQGALRLPIACAPSSVTFPAESFWRAERHRLCDRPELVLRLVDELAVIGVEQLILISPAPPPSTPHSMRARPADPRARVGELLRSMETAALHDGWRSASGRFSGVFIIRPDHNPIGPFNFSVTYDEASDRQRTMADLIQQGHADAYRHFIDRIAAGEPEEEI